MEKFQLWEGFPPLWTAGLGESYPCLEMDKEAKEKQPFVLVCPGGGYQWLAPHEGLPVADFFRQAGFAAGVVSYRVAEQEKAKEPLGVGPLLDVQRAIRLIRRELGEKRKVIVLGFSAGGHVSTCSGVHHRPLPQHPVDGLNTISVRPDAMILCYPWISHSKYVHSRSLATLCGKNDETGLKQFFALDEKVTDQTPPAYLWHTADDTVVPVGNSLNFAEALSSNNVPFALHVFPHGVHGLGLAQEDKLASAWPDLAAAWLKNLFPV